MYNCQQGSAIADQSADPIKPFWSWFTHSFCNLDRFIAAKTFIPVL
jgi:hypothetical protein